MSSDFCVAYSGGEYQWKKYQCMCQGWEGRRSKRYDWVCQGVVMVNLKSGIPSLREPSKSLCYFFLEMLEDAVRYLKLQSTNNSSCLDSKRQVSTQIKTWWHKLCLPSPGAQLGCHHTWQIWSGCCFCSVQKWRAALPKIKQLNCASF